MEYAKLVMRGLIRTKLSHLNYQMNLTHRATTARVDMIVKIKPTRWWNPWDWWKAKKQEKVLNYYLNQNKDYLKKASIDYFFHGR